MPHQANIRRAWTYGLVGFALLSLGDSVIKSIAREWPGTAAAALRFGLAAAGLGVLLWLREGRAGFIAPRPRLQLARGAAMAFASLLFFLAIFVMPLAEATAIQFANPTLAALLSAALLRERISRAAWGAIILAFIGVLIVLRPNVEALGLAALLPLGAALGMVALMMLNRRSVKDVSPLAAQFFGAAWCTPFLLGAALIGHLSGGKALAVSWPELSVVLRCALVAVSASIAHIFIFGATMRASAADIAPTVYVQIIVATIIGIMWFGDWPDPVALAGTALIIAAGLWLWNGSRKSATPPESG
ncbi:MAG: DMT family transporter [Sphingopyxis sp.]|nr:DMT family transporter [Sphingopyxis sp.]